MIQAITHLIVAFVLASSAAAQVMTERQQRIMRTALAADGWLTESDHRAFWADVPAALKSDPAEMWNFAELLERQSGAAMRFQRAVWESLKATVAAKRVLKSRFYEQDKAAILKLIGPLGADGVMEAEAMLEAAASGRSINGPSGRFYITEELIETTLAGLEGSLHRFFKLGNPSWQVAPTERVYPTDHVTLLWDGPFSRKSETIKTATGAPLRLTMLDFRMSESEHVAISFVRLPAAWTTPEASIMVLLVDTLKGMGMPAVGPSTGFWRNRLSATATGSVTTSTGSMHAVVRVVEGREHSGAWQITAVSRDSLPDAIRLHVMLEAALQLEAGPSKPDKPSGPKGSAKAVGQFTDASSRDVTPSDGATFLVNCKFEPSASRLGGGILDLEARALHDDPAFRELSFLLRMRPPDVINVLKPLGNWGKAEIYDGDQDLKLEWHFPLGPRRPQTILIINRFSGEAFQMLTMLEHPMSPDGDNDPKNSLRLPAPDVGKRYGCWGRDGRCEIHQRRL